MNTTATNTVQRRKARRRPGPWQRILPTIVPCKVIYVDALCADVPTLASMRMDSAEHGRRSYLVHTPRQRCKLEEVDS